MFGSFLLLSGCGDTGQPAAPTLDIPVVEVQRRDVAIPLEIVGETIGSVDVTIRARVDGFLDAIHFEEGRFVAERDLLYSIDPRPFETKVMESKGGLAEANTALAKTRSDLDRIRPLAEMNAVSAQDLDAAVAQFEAAQSSVQIAEARVELAEIELGYTQVYAPVGGLIGLTKAEVGDFVGQSATGGVLNIISRTDPIGVPLQVTNPFDPFGTDQKILPPSVARLCDVHEGFSVQGPSGVEVMMVPGYDVQVTVPETLHGPCSQSHHRAQIHLHTVFF